MIPNTESFAAYRDTFHDTWSLEYDGDTVADLWRLDESTHDRHPHHEDRTAEIAEYMALACRCFPDLLAACKALINAPHHEHFETRLNDDEMRGIRLIREAIAKAEGSP